MYTLCFNLREAPTEYGFMPKVTMYLLDRWDKEAERRRPMVIVVPGGGYGCVCKDREGERIALRYNAAGFHAAVLEYAVKPHVHPEPLRNIAKAIEIARDHAEEWQLNPEWIAVCGFSAGGHLCASISTLWNDSAIFSVDEIASKKRRPNASILCDPVITALGKRHMGTFKHLSGEENPATSFLSKMSLETAVNEGTCPSFIWHTFSDNVVPVQSSLLYASALEANEIPFELHIYPNGVHGLALQSDELIWSKPDRGRSYRWMELSVDWLNELFSTTK